MSTEALKPVAIVTRAGSFNGKEFLGTVLPLDCGLCGLKIGDLLYALTPEWRESVIAAADSMAHMKFKAAVLRKLGGE